LETILARDFVDLNRRFQAFTDDEETDFEMIVDRSENWPGDTKTWEELLALPRVVILAEAGSGKSREMKERAIALNTADQVAFYLDLDALARDGLRSCLSHPEEASLEAWMISNQIAWFFLDSVDELKLANGKLETALRKFARSIPRALNRARVIISSRPSDWQAVRDLNTVQSLLPWQATAIENIDLEDEEFFLERVRDRNSNSNVNDEKAPKAPAVSVVKLLPLSRPMIAQYVADLIPNASNFIDAIDVSFAWSFARRPLDLTRLAQRWKAKNALGTLREHIESDIEAQLEEVDPSRPDGQILTPAKAQAGAQKLALALFLSRKRSIQISDAELVIQDRSGALDPRIVLHDWNDAERQSLLRKALFDPATYGRVRFHHRSAEEFLAARLLSSMHREGQLTTPCLKAMLFAEKYGQRVLIPSVRAITAWLALEKPDVFNEICAREPEAMLRYGDLGSLSKEDRIRLLKAFASTYSEGGTRHLNVPLDQVHRLSRPDLSPTIRELWGDGKINEDVRELLIELIWCGKLKGFEDILRFAALNPDFSLHDRVRAIESLVDHHELISLRTIVNEAIANPKQWPIEIMYSAAEYLFPNFMTAEQLLILVEHDPNNQDLFPNFEHAFAGICKRIDLTSKIAIDLRDGLVDLIWRGCKDVPIDNFPESKFAFLRETLLVLCRQQFSATEASNEYLQACSTAWLIRPHHRSEDASENELRNLLISRPLWRKALFEFELDRICSLVTHRTASDKYAELQYYGLLGSMISADIVWLSEACGNSKLPNAKEIVFYGLLHLRNKTSDQKTLTEQLEEFANGDETLLAVIDEFSKPYVESERLLVLRRQSEEHSRQRDDKEAKRIQEWREWRLCVIADPIGAFNAAEKNATIQTLYSWLEMNTRRSQRKRWNRSHLLRAFGQSFTKAAEAEFRQYWRGFRPMLWSEREEKNNYLRAWDLGLCGLQADSENPGWVQALTVEEIRLVAIYSEFESTNFPEFFAELIAARPAEVIAVLAPELRVQLSNAQYQSGLLSKIASADFQVQQYFEPILAEVIAQWPIQAQGESVSFNLEQSLVLLGKIARLESKAQFALLCSENFKCRLDQETRRLWLKGVFRFDSLTGCKLLISELELPDMTSEHCIDLLTTVFNRHTGVHLQFANNCDRAEVLENLVRLAYRYVHPRDDIYRRGAYTPDARDRAEEARNLLVDYLLNTVGHAAHEVRVALAYLPDFEHWKERLLYYSRERVAVECEPDAYSETDVRTFLINAEAPANTLGRLFEVMMSRLEQIRHDIQHGDFSDRGMLRKIDQEEDMQRALAQKLDSAARGLYRVVREDEVADKNKTDIRLLSASSADRAVIEVKLGEKDRSAKDLADALRDQLIEKYLRHDNCRAGCLLITLANPKRTWTHPQTKAKMQLTDLITYLQECAKQAEITSKFTIRVNVFGIAL
jgi:hypothetical protein